MKFTQRDMGQAAEVNAPDPRSQTRDAFMLLGCLLLAGVAIFYGVLFAVDRLVAWIPPEAEARMFSEVPLEHLLPLPPESPSSLDVWALWEDTLEKLRSHPAVLPLAYRLVMVKADQPNAFAIPGGVIAVTSALVDVVGSDEITVAMILGHELGHFAHRDHLRGLGRAVVLGLLLSTVVGSDLGVLGQLALNLEELRYSRRQEQQADLYGARVVLDTFGDTGSFDRLLRQLTEEESLPSWAYMFSTHPHPEERIRALETFMREYRSE